MDKLIFLFIFALVYYEIRRKERRHHGIELDRWSNQAPRSTTSGPSRGDGAGHPGGQNGQGQVGGGWPQDATEGQSGLGTEALPYRQGLSSLRWRQIGSGGYDYEDGGGDPLW